MCIAVPGRISSIDEHDVAIVDFGGTTRAAMIDLVPDVAVGDYVLVHAGFVINKLSEEDALETLQLFREYMGMMEEE
jgi:hydrogenase expression/formation protein HypC